MGLFNKKESRKKMRKKIKISDDDYEELLELLKVGIMLEKTGKEMIKKIENILSTLSTYGVEVPNKRIEKMINENSKSIKWLDMN
jgi:hypothetical protein